MHPEAMHIIGDVAIAILLTPLEIVDERPEITYPPVVTLRSPKLSWHRFVLASSSVRFMGYAFFRIAIAVITWVR